jgi:PAS domain S-box-containing protein
MSNPTGITVAVAAIIAAMLVLAVAILIGMVVHSRRMRESEKRFRLLFTNAFDALILADESGFIIEANNSACKLIGLKMPEFAGRKVQDLLSDGDSIKFQATLKRSASKGSDFFGEISFGDDFSDRRFAEGGIARFDFLDERYIIVSMRDITERREADEALKAERRTLYEKNVALKEVLQHIEEEKAELKRAMADKIEQVIFPIVRKMSGAKDAGFENYHALLLDELRKLSGPNLGLPSLYYKLSPREIEICDLIKTGASTKEIARTLNITMSTVNKHRERIRNRLDIAHRDVNLAAFLQKLE